MKVFIQSADNQGRINGSILTGLLQFFTQTTSVHDADVCVVPISFFHDYKFNVKLWDISQAGKPWVMIDFMEYEWCYFNEKKETHLFGKNTLDCRWLNPNWHPLDEWAKNHPPTVYFKRELLSGEVSDTVKPIDWPCYLPSVPFQNEHEFNQRPLEVFYNFGYSHPNRPILHGDIFKGMVTHGLGIISEKSQWEGYFQNPHARSWASIFCPWYSRVAIADTVWWQQRAKITPSLFGCGRKCFRHGEIVDSIMAKQIDELAWSFPWTEENCVLLRPGHEFEDLEAATHRSDLYEVYKAGHANVDRYRGSRFVAEYLAPIIESKLPKVEEVK